MIELRSIRILGRQKWAAPRDRVQICIDLSSIVWRRPPFSVSQPIFADLTFFIFLFTRVALFQSSFLQTCPFSDLYNFQDILLFDHAICYLATSKPCSLRTSKSQNHKQQENLHTPNIAPCESRVVCPFYDLERSHQLLLTSSSAWWSAMLPQSVVTTGSRAPTAWSFCKLYSFPILKFIAESSIFNRKRRELVSFQLFNLQS